MVATIALILVMVGMVKGLDSASDWFLDTKGINILPATGIDLVALFMFFLNTDSDFAIRNVWGWLGLAIVAAGVVYNLVSYGPGTGLLASVAELFFSAAFVFLIAFIILSSTERKKRRQRV